MVFFGTKVIIDSLCSGRRQLVHNVSLLTAGHHDGWAARNGQDTSSEGRSDRMWDDVLQLVCGQSDV